MVGFPVLINLYYIRAGQKYYSFTISLSMRSIGQSFITLQSVDSTNNYAMAQVHAGLALHGNAYFALAQTKGKGQRGKEWNTAVGENIIISIVFQPAGLLLTDQFILIITTALGCYDFVNSYTHCDVCIKWPNDIYWRDRKAGGILIENVVQGLDWQFAVVGIGININQALFPGYLPNPVSLKLITGDHYNVQIMARELCNYLQSRYQQLLNGKRRELLHEYNSILFMRNRIVKLKQGSRVFETLIKGVDIQGRLITHHTFEQPFEFGEVEWVM